MDPRSEEKRRRLERALEKGPVMVHVDARRPGVIVPARLRDDFHLRLNLSLRFDPPDLSVGEWGVRETLSFGGVRFAVAVPWSAIFAITGAQRGEQARVYTEDMPRELFEEAARRFGLTTADVDQLRREAQEIDRMDLAPGTEPEAVRAAEVAARRRALQVVQTQASEPHPEPEAQPDGAPAAATPGEPALQPCPASPDADDKAGRRGHLKLIK